MDNSLKTSSLTKMQRHEVNFNILIVAKKYLLLQDFVGQGSITIS